MGSQSGDTVQHSMRFVRERVDQVIAEADREMAAEMSAKVAVEEKLVVEAKAPEIPKKAEASSRRSETFTDFLDAHGNQFCGASLGFGICFLFLSMGFAGFYNWAHADVTGAKSLGRIMGWWTVAICVPPILNLPSNGAFLGYPALALVFFARKNLSGIFYAITNTAFGVWTVAKSTVVGIGTGIKWIGIGLYYIITNQLMPSACWKYASTLYSTCSSDDVRPLLTSSFHFIGVLASIVAFGDGWGPPLVGKLIIGWWGFYILNLFYMIGREARAKKVS